MAIDLRVDSDTPGFIDWPSGYEFKTGGTQSDQINHVSSPVRQGHNCLQYKVRSGDNTAVNQQRAEGRWFGSNEQEFEGQWRWFAWSTYFEDPWQVSSSFQIYTQWHADSNFVQAPIKFNCRAQSSSDFQLRLGFNTGEEKSASSWDYNTSHVLLNSPSTNVWYDHIVGFKMARDFTGAARVLLRESTDDVFTLVLSLDNIPTLVWKTINGTPTLGDYFLKQGLYRDDETFTNTIYHDNMRRGATATEVGEEFGFTGFIESPVAASTGTLSASPASTGSLTLSPL